MGIGTCLPIFIGFLVLVIMGVVFFVKSRKKPKKYALVVLIPTIISLCVVIGGSIYLNYASKDIRANNKYNRIVSNFLNDYNIYIEKWRDRCSKYDSPLEQKYDFSLDLNELLIMNSAFTYDTENFDNFSSYFKHYYGFNNSSEFLNLGPYSCKNLSYENKDIGILYEFGISLNGGQMMSSLIIFYDDYDGSYFQDCYSYSFNLMRESYSVLNTCLNTNSFSYEDVYTYDFPPALLIVIFSSLSLMLNIANIIYCLVKKDKKALETSANVSVNAAQQIQNETPPPKPKWKELKDEEQKTFIDKAIKTLYETQLNDTNIQLTRQERALKKDCIANNEFYIDDLNAEEQKEILKTAKDYYEKGLSDENEYDKILKENSKLTDQEKKEKYKEQYKKSNRHKINIIAITTLTVGLVLGLPINLIMQLALHAPSGLIMVVCIAAVICFFVSFIFFQARKKCCKYCGTNGVVWDSKEQSEFAIEGTRVNWNFQISGNYRGHLNYKNGEPYLENVVENVEKTELMVCPCCLNSWIVKSHKQIKH